MDAANGAATATISNGGTPVAPTARTAVDTLVIRNITDHTAPDATALRECHLVEAVASAGRLASGSNRNGAQIKSVLFAEI